MKITKDLAVLGEWWEWEPYWSGLKKNVQRGIKSQQIYQGLVPGPGAATVELKEHEMLYILRKHSQPIGRQLSNQ